MKYRSFVFPLLFIILLLPVIVSSQEITGVKTEGECKEFTVTINASGIGESCWDVKLDVPGKVYDAGEKKWKSGFYYINRLLCYPDTQITIDVRIDTGVTPVQAVAKLRQGSKIIEKDFTIFQNCPQSLPDELSIIVAFIIILVFGWSLAWWWKQKQET